MVMKPEPMFEAVEAILGEAWARTPRILLTPQGSPLTQARAGALARQPRLVLLCGRYEGVDERVRLHLTTEELSIGDYVLTGGEIPALVIIDCVARLLPGALGDESGAEHDSFSAGRLEYPHYTRPPEYRGWQVPEVLVSGDHARIREWRLLESLRRTRARRPDLLAKTPPTPEERELLEREDRSRPEDRLR